MVAGILPPTPGSLAFDGKPVWHDGKVGAKETTLAIQITFQDPFTTLDPRLPVPETIGETPRVHRRAAPRDVADSVDATMISVSLRPAFPRRSPHPCSQRTPPRT